MFENREDAGRQLAKKLESFKGESAVVVALPRGGVITAAPVAELLGAPLTVVTPRKIGHPELPESAVAAVDETGAVVENKAAVQMLPSDTLARLVMRGQDESRRRRHTYLAGRKQPSLEEKIVIVVDDGIATGLTMQAALGGLRKAKPEKLVVAVPVALGDTRNVLAELSDEVITLHEDPFSSSIGVHYDEFSEVPDQEVNDLLDRYG